MKPPKRPGKPATAPLTHRAMQKAKPIDLTLLPKKGRMKKTSKKEGRRGKMSNWDLSYSEGNLYAKKKMRNAEYENFSQDGIRTLPKRGRTIS